MSGDSVTTLRNIGPALGEALAGVGLGTVDAFRRAGADAAYASLIAAGTRPHFIGFYVLEMALQNRPWNDCKGEEKTALRERFDAIVVGRATTPDADRIAFAAMMDAIGVVER
ncbi:TfoX/Sxy family DNA transformation protein [Jannaschia sp. LMIT008]|uniref:TfoX/Sxy family DNA transformation protein n=1 Tax=Jannaschia maritima TaxID=3032585 RepID=UPI0028119981|nr:TfoX/Sxy family DNA transformation protein [Jannaschia sp. LMIT008]